MKEQIMPQWDDPREPRVLSPLLCQESCAGLGVAGVAERNKKGKNHEIQG